MATRNALLDQSRVVPPNVIADHGRATVYGGVVGQMIEDIDLRLSRSLPPNPAHAAEPDFLHMFSVLCGYAGLAAGFGTVALILIRLF